MELYYILIFHNIQFFTEATHDNFILQNCVSIQRLSLKRYRKTRFKKKKTTINSDSRMSILLDFQENIITVSIEDKQLFLATTWKYFYRLSYWNSRPVNASKCCPAFL